MHKLRTLRASSVSHGAMATLLLAMAAAQPAHGQGFAGAPTVAFGNATIAPSGPNSQTISIPVSSPVTTINWAPTDTAVGGGVINFLPLTESVAFQGQPGANLPYTVLNRILPVDATRTVAFNGSVTSGVDVRVWFYSPGGLLIGKTASFNVGGLVLTTADPVVDASGSFMGTFDRFSLAAPAGATSAVTIASGAKIKVDFNGYMVAFGQKIAQRGTLDVLGKTALVAAESADFAIDSTGLFSISVTSGTSATSDAFIHTGSTGGSDSATNTDTLARRVYMVAVPKNNAITMAISSSGSIGFDIAGAAQQDGNAVVLSAGYNINDSGTAAGNPIVGDPAGSGFATLQIAAGSYSSRTYAAATGALAAVNVPGDTPADLTFNADAILRAPSVTMTATTGTIRVDGNLVLSADATGITADRRAGTATLATGIGTPGAIVVGSSANSLGVNGDLLVTAEDNFGALGGDASIVVNGGSLTVANNATVSGRGTWDGVGALNLGGIVTTGGTASMDVNSAGTAIIGGQLVIDASADGTNAGTAYSAAAAIFPNTGMSANANAASLIVSGNGSQLDAGSIAAFADATGGIDVNIGVAGDASGGQATISADTGGLIRTTNSNGEILARTQATAGGGVADNILGGSARGGFSFVTAATGTITTLGANGIAALASAFGGNGGGSSGDGGNATGGFANIEAQGGGLIQTNTSNAATLVDGGPRVIADAVGGSAIGNGLGGRATAGTATLLANGGTIAFDHGNDAFISATASGGTGFNGGGGQATGGQTAMQANGGTISLTNVALTMSVNANGGGDNGSGAGGNAAAGTIDIQTSNFGVISVSGRSALAGSGTYAAAAIGGGSSSLARGGDATGGNILVSDVPSGGAINLDGPNFGIAIDTSSAGGSGGSGVSTGLADSAGGALFTSTNDFNIGGLVTLQGNTSLVLRTAGSIDVSGSGQIVGTGPGAYLALQSDMNGSGTGTVTLGAGALDLSGTGAAIDIYYNPASFGTPTDYSPGVTSGLWTGYQLVNTVDQLQQVGSFLDQNFALGRDIDASQTQGWNAGAGFVPIGSNDLSNPFVGNFDGLDHVVSNLFINIPGGRNTGLFATVGNGSGAQISIRNIGLINANVTGGGSTISSTGGLIGYVLPGSNQVLVNNAFVTGQVTAGWDAGGLIGESDNPNFILSNSHSDAAVTVNGGSFAGGLVGYLLAGHVIQSWATGTVTMTGNGIRNLGGLIGDTEAGTTVTRSYATGDVIGGTNLRRAGGLIGYNLATVTQSYATGSVTVGTGGTRIGGLIGLNDVGSGPLGEVYASGLVTAPGSPSVGGLVGENNASIVGAYWDTFSTGQANPIGVDNAPSNIVLPVTSDPGQTGAFNYALRPSTYSLFGANWIYFGDDNVASRPMGVWELPRARYGIATIASAHQVELIDRLPSGTYSLQHDIAMTGATALGDVWGGLGFMPIGYGGRSFDGTLRGNGRVLYGLTVTNNGNTGNGGLFDINAGAILDLGIVGGSVQGEFTDAGLVAGRNPGNIFDSFATGTVQGTIGSAGGLVGSNFGFIGQSYADVSVQAGINGEAGGLVGANFGNISQTYARGAVAGGTANGLIGDNSGQAIASYWDTELSGQTLGCGGGATCAGVTGLTTAQTLQAGSFADFGGTIDTVGGQPLPWRIYEGQTTPLLKRFLSRVTIQASDATLTYNATVPTVGFTSFGALPGHTGGTASFTGIDANAGTHSVFYGGGLFSDQTGHDFVASTTPGTIVINPAALTLDAVSDSRTYNATTGSAGTVSVTGLQGNDSVSGLTQAFDSANAGNRTLSVNSGYTINDGNSGGNYTVTSNTAVGSITAAQLTLSAATDSRTYDATNISTGTVGVSGLQGSDSVSGLAQSFDSANVGNRTLSVNNGYTVNDGNSGNNYTVTSQTAAGSISAAALTFNAVTDSRTYDATAASAGQVQVLGLQGNDSVSGLAQSFDSSNVGNRTLAVSNGYTINDGNGGNNYAITSNSAAGSITAAPLTISAVTDSRTYNATKASAGLVLVLGLQGNDNVTGLVQSFDSANVGARTLSVNSGFTVNDGNSGGNYSVSTVSAFGTITPAPLNVTYTANPVSNVYGNAIPTLSGTVSASGLQGSEALSDVTTGSASFSTQASSSSGIGTYAITGSGLTASSANYQFNFQQAPANAQAFTIVVRPLTITADPQSRKQGTDNPELTFSIVGLVNEDSVNGSLATTATSASPAGSYAITQGSLAATANYQISYVGNFLVVTNGSGPAQQVGGTIAGNLPSQSAGGGNENGERDPNAPGLTEEERRQLASVSNGLSPPSITQSLISDGSINQPSPVTSPVTSNGNPSQWPTTQTTGESQ